MVQEYSCKRAVFTGSWSRQSHFTFDPQGGAQPPAVDVQQGEAYQRLRAIIPRVGLAPYVDGVAPAPAGEGWATGMGRGGWAATLIPMHLVAHTR